MVRAMTMVATEEERADIETFSRAIEGVADHARITVEGERSETVTIPDRLLEILRLIADQMAKGRSISLIPKGMLVTTQQAAQLLGSSRQHVVKLLTNGEIPFVTVGTHRRIEIDDLMAYKARRAESREAALRRLSEQAERLGIEY